MIDLSNPLGQAFSHLPRDVQKAMVASSGRVEVYGDGGWRETPSPAWFPSGIYRVKPTPTRKTVSWCLENENFRADVAIDFVDGKPDWSTLRKWTGE